MAYQFSDLKHAAKEIHRVAVSLVIDRVLFVVDFNELPWHLIDPAEEVVHDVVIFDGEVHRQRTFFIVLEPMGQATKACENGRMNRELLLVFEVVAQVGNDLEIGRKGTKVPELIVSIHILHIPHGRNAYSISAIPGNTLKRMLYVIGAMVLERRKVENSRLGMIVL